MSMRAALWSISAVLACSTVAPAPESAECSVDDDCKVAGEVCAPDTRVCVPSSAVPPRRDLAFDIQEPQGFRAEVSACDCEVTQDTANNALRVRRPLVRQLFELDVYKDGEVDPETTNPDDVVAADMQLSSTTRFSAGTVPPTIPYPITDGALENPQLVQTVAAWSRYHPYDVVPPQLDDGGYVLWRVVPASGAAMVYQLIRPAESNPLRPCQTDDQCRANPRDINFCLPSTGECTNIGDPHFAYGFAYDQRCDREISGRAIRVDPMTLAPVADPMGNVGIEAARISLRYADTEGEDRLGLFSLEGEAVESRDPECVAHDRDDPDDDEGCVRPDELCDPDTRQCMLALAGRAADNGGVQTAADGGFATHVFSYCARDRTDLPLTRSYELSVSPTGATPSVDFAFDIEFPPLNNGVAGGKALPETLCIPDWGPPVGVTVDLEGDARTLLGSGAQAYKCCDVSCLPATPEDAAAATELPSATKCDGRTSAGPPTAVVDTPLKDTLAPEVWLEAGCMPPLRGADDRVGGIRSPIDCNATQGTCFLPDLAAGRDGAARDYSMRIEMPVGSLFRSFVHALPIDASSATTPQSFELTPRVLVRGRVKLDDPSCEAAAPADGDCGSEGAVVLAERLRMPTDDPETNAFPPYFHQVSTYYDVVDGQRGAYVLPLDPGVYLITALPVSGTAGGPAAISVVDLRDERDVARDLVLESGIIVTLDLGESFDRSTQVVPLDRGSWRGQLHPGRIDDPDPAEQTLDLNAPGECMSATGDGRCRIRRLVAGAGITGNLAGEVRFIARQGDGGSCPVDETAPACPAPP